MSSSTSTSDCSSYKDVCIQAVANDAVFNTFKQHPGYTPILEHVDYDLGNAYINQFIQDVVFSKNINKFKVNDKLGGPRTYSFSIGNFSPTTLRYIKVLKDLSQLNLNDIDIVEIGAGYGGQYTVMRQIYKPKKYTFVDLPEVLALIKKYVETLGLNDIELEYVDYNNVKKAEHDLVISNYAISECEQNIQDLYIENIIRTSKHGYIIHNNFRGYSHPQFIEKCALKIKTSSEIPNSGPQNVLLSW